MAKRKTVTHLPAAPPPAPQLATQLFTVTAEIFVVIVIGVGLLTVAGWLLDRERGACIPSRRSICISEIYPDAKSPIRPSGGA
jgi:hypothetical protein